MPKKDLRKSNRSWILEDERIYKEQAYVGTSIANTCMQDEKVMQNQFLRLDP